MFKFFRKKPALTSPEEKIPEKPKKSEPEMMTFDQGDDCFVRAEKIIKYTGLIDTCGISSHAARVVKIYMDLDKKVLESNTK